MKNLRLITKWRSFLIEKILHFLSFSGDRAREQKKKKKSPKD